MIIAPSPFIRWHKPTEPLCTLRRRAARTYPKVLLPHASYSGCNWKMPTMASGGRSLSFKLATPLRDT